MSESWYSSEASERGGRARSDSVSSTREDHTLRGLFDRYLRWVVENWVERILLPALFTALRFVAFFVVSVLAYVAFYRWLVPAALAQEPVYFDYTKQPPTALVNLLSLEKQWAYTELGKSSGSGAASHDFDAVSISGSASGDKLAPRLGKKGSNRQAARKAKFLRSDFYYTIDATFHLSKSARNFDLGKFMVGLAVVDVTGASIARSARPVSVPYQSTPTLWLDSVCKYPWRALGLVSPHETARVDVPLMNSYREPHSSTHAEALELTLTDIAGSVSGSADIAEAFVTVMPELRGAAWYMWYYPRLSALVGVTTFTGAQAALYLTYLLVLFAMRALGVSGMNGNSEERPASASASNKGESVSASLSLSGADTPVPLSLAGGSDDDDESTESDSDSDSNSYHSDSADEEAMGSGFKQRVRSDYDGSSNNGSMSESGATPSSVSDAAAAATAGAAGAGGGEDDLSIYDESRRIYGEVRSAEPMKAKTEAGWGGDSELRRRAWPASASSD